MASKTSSGSGIRYLQCLSSYCLSVGAGPLPLTAVTLQAWLSPASVTTELPSSLEVLNCFLRAACHSPAVPSWGAVDPALAVPV